MYQLWPEQATAVIKNETPLVLVGDYIDPLAVRSSCSLLEDEKTLKRGSNHVRVCGSTCPEYV